MDDSGEREGIDKIRLIGKRDVNCHCGDLYIKGDRSRSCSLRYDFIIIEGVKERHTLGRERGM
jgi:hypothetical protein